MKRSFLFLLSLIIVAGCASTKVTNRQELVSGPLPRPNMIWVYDFAATAADIPADSALAGQVSRGGGAGPDGCSPGLPYHSVSPLEQ